MRHEQIARYMTMRPWAMQPEALALMVEVLAARMAGEPSPVAWDGETNHGGTPWFAEVDAAIPGQTATAVARKAGRVAVLPLRGSIHHRMGGVQEMSGGTSLERFTKNLRGLMADGSTKAVILDVDSPGGSVDGLPEAAEEIRAMRGAKPLVAQVNVRAASAAYWLATQADEVVVTPSGEVGSIGIVSVHDDLSEAYAKAGIKRTVIASSEHKAEGHPFAPLSDEALAHIREQSAVFDGMFHDAVAAGRGVKASVVRETYGRGRMVLAEDAVGRGMADRIATLSQTLARFGGSMVGGAREAAQVADAKRRREARRFLRRDLLR